MPTMKIWMLATHTDRPIREKEFSYNEEDIWNLIKDHKKAMKKKGLK
jgi:hypothetical protein